MSFRNHLACVALSALAGAAAAQEHDYYKHLRYPARLVEGVGRNRVQQEGGPHAVGYKRRTVHWWLRKGQDIVDVPKGAPLRVWTRNKGQDDPEALAGVCRNWTASEPETFKAHLIGFRGFGIETPDPRFDDYRLTPAAVLRMENGERRAVLAYPPFSMMVSQEDHDFIHGIWREEWKKLQAAQSQDEYETNPYRRKPDSLVLETKHFTFVSAPSTQYRTLWWMRPHEPAKQDLYRRGTLEFAENMWTHIEAAGCSMPYWRRPGPRRKYSVLIRLAVDGGYAGGGFNACDLRDATGGPRNLGLSHEWYHGHPGGGWAAGYFAESVCHGGRHFNIPGEMLMFSANFCYPWRNVNCTQYQSPLWWFALGDNPNWGYSILSVAGCLAAACEPTPFHTIARLGQRKGLWANGVKGFGDFFGEYAARMATCDFVMQYPIRSKYGMPEMSFLRPVYGRPGCYRVPNSEAPRMYGFNLVRLVPERGAEKITVDLRGLAEPADRPDWRACIVAVDGEGRARYSPLWNRGRMDFALKPSDKHLWLTVAATPSALPMPPAEGRDSQRGREQYRLCMAGPHAPRFPWEVTLTGCSPGSPHRRQGDVINLDELYAMNNGNKYMGYAVKCEVPIPLSDKHGRLAQRKLADMLRRITAARAAQKRKIAAGRTEAGFWWEKGKVEVAKELTERIQFLQRNAKGRPHPNGGGFVAANARVAKTAYVGPNAMVLDGARVEGYARICEHAVVHGPKTVIRGHAKVGGAAWVFGDVTVGGNARILESAVVTTVGRARASYAEGQAEITGNAVIKGDHILRLCEAKGQVLTGALVMDYTPGTDGVVGYGNLVPGIVNLTAGVFDRGRVCGRGTLGGKVGAGGLYANWQFNQPKAAVLEDSYVNNNGVLHGRPGFVEDGARRCIVFNGKDEYAEAPPSVADFGELTIDTMIAPAGGNGGRIFDFGTGDNECFYLALEGEGIKPVLRARHDGKSHRLAAREPLAVNTWVRLRVEMDGATAALHVDGKQVAKGAFPFRPRSVFPGDRPEGNFIACGRNRDKFFQGRIDHFRIYRGVHDGFDALGPPPFALTQRQEWSERHQQLADAWDGRRRAAEAELKAGQYGRLQDEIRQLNDRLAALRRTDKLKELEARARDAEKARRDLDRKIHNEFRALETTVEAEREGRELRVKIDAILRQVLESREVVQLTNDIRACEKRRSEIDKQVRETPWLRDLAAKAEAADRGKRNAEERIRRLPELERLKGEMDREKDGRKKRELRDAYNRLFEARRLSDPAWRKAEVARQRLWRSHRDGLRGELDSNAARIRLEQQIRRLRGHQSALTAKLRKSHSELLGLEASAKAKRTALDQARRQFELQARAKDEYKSADAALAAARKAVEDERRRLEGAKTKESQEIAARIEDLRTKARSLWDNALKEAGLFGPNPHPGAAAARMKAFQDSLIYHTTADWDDRTREEVRGEVTERMKRWLKRVRGY